MMKKNRICSIEKCEKKHEALGFCVNHYQIYKKYGDPLKIDKLKKPSEPLNLKGEVWKDIPGYEGYYQCSDFGRIKSFHRNKTQILSNTINDNGYYVSGLSINGKTKTLTVHFLLGITFLNYIPSRYKIVIDHIDNNRLNNKLSNLQIITTRENTTKDQINKYGYTGVCKLKKRWGAYIEINANKIYLGSSLNKIDASKMYKKALLNIDKYNGCNAEFRNFLKKI